MLQLTTSLGVDCSNMKFKWENTSDFIVFVLQDDSDAYSNNSIKKRFLDPEARHQMPQFSNGKAHSLSHKETNNIM